MQLKRMILALCACLVVGAAVASAAQAASWKVGPTKAPLAEETVSVSSNGPVTLTSSPLEISVKLTAEHLGCSGTCKISGEGHSEGHLVFTGVTVDQPSGCTVHTPGAANGTVATEALTDQLGHPDASNPTATFDEFFPEATNGVFFTLVLGGSSCVLEGLEIPFEGTLYGRTNNTGVMASPQTIVFNATEEAAAGSTLNMGGSAVDLTGEALNTLSGTHAGQVFGAE